jgi:hypothetical protein
VRIETEIARQRKELLWQRDMDTAAEVQYTKTGSLLLSVP